jgi:hypothetical protein
MLYSEYKCFYYYFKQAAERCESHMAQASHAEAWRLRAAAK